VQHKLLLLILLLAGQSSCWDFCQQASTAACWLRMARLQVQEKLRRW
jgi:hypothetical protein